jgi:predicted phage terminase large subunit-like protein
MPKRIEKLTLTRKQYYQLLRRDFVAFARRAFAELNPGTCYLHNWHIDVLAAALEECRRGETKRLIANLPPRHLKSHLFSVVFVAWVLGHNPAARIICVSYGQELADNLAAACRALMLSSFYRELFPGTRLSSTRQAIHDFRTTQNGYRLATSVGGSLIGRGANYIIVDDPIKPEEAFSDALRKSVNDWFDHTLITRLDDKANGCILLVMQRLHEDDPTGHLLNQGGWKHLSFPAIAERDELHTIETIYGRRTFSRRVGEALHLERESIETLQSLRRVQGEYNFSGQYQQRPAPMGGGTVQSKWFQSYLPSERPQEFELILQSWDTANKTSERNDYSVCTTWGLSEKRVYLLDVLRLRLEYPELRRLVKSHAEFFHADDILIEDKASGTQLIQDLRADGVDSVRRYASKMDKNARMGTSSSLIENGFVYFPSQADWLESYRHELLVFPGGHYDDQADSTSQAWEWIKRDMLEP